MGKQWDLTRTELTKEPVYGKLHNPKKFAELGTQLEEVCEKSNNHRLVNRLCRKVIEEVTNIAQHDEEWTKIKVNSKFNQDGTNYKIVITFDGNYHDPSNLSHIMDTGTKFAEFIRSHEEKEGEVTIRLQVKL